MAFSQVSDSSSRVSSQPASSDLQRIEPTGELPLDRAESAREHRSSPARTAGIRCRATLKKPLDIVEFSGID
jgi:hypothetical protein